MARTYTKFKKIMYTDQKIFKPRWLHAWNGRKSSLALLLQYCVDWTKIQTGN